MLVLSSLGGAATAPKKKERSMQVLTHLRFAIWLSAVFAFALCIFRASAQSSSTMLSDPPSSPDPADHGWHFSLTPYLWFSGIHGNVGVLGRDASIHASASDVLSNLDLGFMILADPRYNRIVFPIDFMWVKLSDSKGFPLTAGYLTAKVTTTERILTQKIGYRFVDKPRFKVDALWGYRYWYLTNSLNLQLPPASVNFSDSRGWVDAVSGAKFEITVTRKVSVTVFGDAGGGSARFDYQVGGALGFRVAQKWTLQAGYRYMGVDYGSPSNFLFDVAQSGVVFGATWTPK